ncbi:MAG: dephospho-CoA kinase [Gammaproteobacteria bacterium]|nr:dephospho-CoA kinase [Gammaproteobacteria bacterium]
MSTQTPLVIGLTGGIGSGKTVVSDLFAKIGVTIIDTDLISREIVKPQQPAWQQIVEHFSETILLPDKTLNRRLLRDKIFADSNERAWLESLLHPMIRCEMQRQIQQALSPYVIAVIPLLTETAPNPLINRVLVVDAPEELQVARTMARDQADREAINAIIAHQTPRPIRLTYADDVIENNGDLAQLQSAVENLHQKYLQISTNDR